MPYIKYSNLKLFLFTYKAVILFTGKLNQTEQIRNTKNQHYIPYNAELQCKLK